MEHIMTHKYIKSRILRKAYAEELNAARRMLFVLNPQERMMFRIGIESAFWKMQRVLQ
jgi:hypothetical protein